MSARFHLAVVILNALAASVSFAAAPATQPAGPSTVSWPLPPDPGFEKSYTALGTRHGFKIPDNYPQKKRDEWLSKSGQTDPTYDLYVPPAPAADGKYGLFVWISSGPAGKVPREDWLRTLDDRHMIWVGPNHVGNETDTLLRTWMATEAVRNAKREFPIDETRIYVAGVSGGGRIASHAAVVCADVFTGGGFYFVGCDFYRDVPEIANATQGRHYRGFWPKPDVKILRLAKQRRHVLLTGSEDSNRINTHAVYDGFRKSKFEHAALLEVKGLGHTLPDGEWFEKGMKLLDQPGQPATRPAPKSRIILGPR